ncbi:hypothetical protein [Chelatococcus reniformis]|uniref:Uncharacterized protein n=1 Tax=Chelatococcus reniformis TaxID=1494448 RepID=A0A916XI16_9HYPH|nr:hypothetical protein [Chelatococcus reniformis]GGC74731.1 hypothetical protein GCM10010994_36500 [Chelatococcus reniformis]
MSQSFERVLDGAIEALRTTILPHLSDSFVRGQAYGVIFALNGLKLGADWAAGPLLAQVALQDKAFAAVSHLAGGLSHPPIPALPRLAGGVTDGAALEALRDEGDRQLGALLMWASGDAASQDQAVAGEIQDTLRRFMREQMTLDIGTMAKSMFHELATGEDSPPGVSARG